MPFAADEVASSLTGAWELLQRRDEGLRRFDFGGVARSFAAIALCAPVFVIMLAAARAEHGLLTPGADLFGDPSLILAVALLMAIGWLAFPLVASGFAVLLGQRRRLPNFLVVSNWSFVLASGFFAVPAFLYALDLATPQLTVLYCLAALALATHLRWFALKATLGFSSGLAMVVVCCDLGVETLLTRLIA